LENKSVVNKINARREASAKKSTQARSREISMDDTEASRPAMTDSLSMDQISGEILRPKENRFTELRHAVEKKTLNLGFDSILAQRANTQSIKSKS
jgi:hypothetical protein